MSGQLVFALSQVIGVLYEKDNGELCKAACWVTVLTNWMSWPSGHSRVDDQSRGVLLSALQLPCALSTVFPLQTFQPPWCLHSSTSSVHYWTLATSIPLLHKLDGPNS
jgi:hypothetical protein